MFGEVHLLPHEPESPHAHRLQIGVPAYHLVQAESEGGRKCGAEIPAGDFEGCAKDLGTYKLRHGDLIAEAALGKLEEASWRR